MKEWAVGSVTPAGVNRSTRATMGWTTVPIPPVRFWLPPLRPNALDYAPQSLLLSHKVVELCGVCRAPATLRAHRRGGLFFWTFPHWQRRG